MPYRGVAMQNFISAILGGLIVGALFLCFSPATPDGVVSVDDARATNERVVEARTDPAVSAPLADLRNRILELEERANSSSRTVPVRTPIDYAATAALAARVQALEAQLRDLKQRISLACVVPEHTDSPEAALEAIHSAVGRATHENGKNYLSAVVAIQHRLQFLERWPQHEQAQSQLSNLVHDYRATSQLNKAKAAIERFGPETGLSSFELDRLRLSAAQGRSEQIKFLRRLARGATDRLDKEWALWELAKSLEYAGQSSEAIATADALLRLSPTTHVHSNVVRSFRQRVATDR